MRTSCPASLRNAYRDRYSLAFASSRISHPLSRRLPLRVGFHRNRHDGTGRGYSVPQTYRCERRRQPLSPDGRTGVSSRHGNVSNGPHPFWAKRCSPRRVSAPFRLFSLTRFIRTSHVFAISFRPSLLAALVLAAMTAAFQQAVSVLSLVGWE